MDYPNLFAKIRQQDETAVTFMLFMVLHQKVQLVIVYRLLVFFLFWCQKKFSFKK